MKPIVRSVAGLVLLGSFIGLVQAQTSAAQNQAKQLYAQASILENQKQYPQAIKLMQQAVQLQPKSDQYLGYLAKLEFLAGDYKEATDHAVAAAKINSRAPLYQVVAMKAAAKSNNFEVAKKFAENVIKLKIGGDYLKEAKEILAQAESQKGERFYLQAIEFHRRGDIRSAIGAVNQAKEAAPGNQGYADYLILLERKAASFDLDVHARKADIKDEGSLEALAAYLTKPAKSDEDKARAIFAWITDRIEHDVEARRTGKADDVSAKGALTTRRATPEGYANLFSELGKLAKLDVEIVKGHAKGPGFQPDQDLVFWKHHWNAVKIGDKWQLVDCCWGAGESFTKFDKKFRPFFFFPNADALLFTHYPEEEKYLLVERPPSRDKWKHLAKVDPALFDLGVLPSKARELAGQQGFKGFVRAQAEAGPQIFLHEAPIEGQLRAGLTYSFRIEAIGFDEMIISSGGKFEVLKRNGKVFEGSIMAKPGNLFVSAKITSRDENFRQVLTYEVE